MRRMKTEETEVAVVQLKWGLEVKASVPSAGEVVMITLKWGLEVKASVPSAGEVVMITLGIVMT
jgi:hypothetical protein